MVLLFVLEGIMTNAFEKNEKVPYYIGVNSTSMNIVAIGTTLEECKQLIPEADLMLQSDTHSYTIFQSIESMTCA